MTQRTVATPTIRVVLLSVAGLLRDIIRQSLEDAPDITVVGEVSDQLSLQRLLRRIGADIVLCTAERNAVLTASPGSFGAQPALKILAVSDDGHGWVCEALGEVSPQILVDTIRKVVAR